MPLRPDADAPCSNVADLESAWDDGQEKGSAGKPAEPLFE